MPNYNNIYGGYPYGQTFNPYSPPQQPQQNYNVPPLNQYAYVNGPEGAKAFQVPPNQTMMLMDNDNPIVYMKQASATGQSFIRYFKLIEINEDQLKNKSSEVNYALKSDLDSILARLSKLEEINKKED